MNKFYVLISSLMFIAILLIEYNSMISWTNRNEYFVSKIKTPVVLSPIKQGYTMSGIRLYKCNYEGNTYPCMGGK